MEQPTPKFDQIKKLYLKRGGVVKKSQAVPIQNCAVTAASVQVQQPLPEKGASEDKTAQEITALLARVIETRQQRGDVGPLQGAPPSPRSPRQGPSLLMATLSNVIQQKYTSARSARLSPIPSQKAPDFAKIYRGIDLAVQEGDEYELLGWFQEKAKRLGQDFALSEVRDVRARRHLDPTIKTDQLQLNEWEDLQMYLDGLKSSIKGTAVGKPRSQPPTDSNCTAAVLNALHEVSMLLIADKVRDQTEYIGRLRVTVEEQAELLEVRQERLVELREKVREYGRENADLEGHNEDLKLDLSDALSLRYEAEERVLLLERRCQQLESEVAARTAELGEARRALTVTRTEASVASAAAVPQLPREQSSRGVSRLQAFEARIARHSRTHGHGVLSDSDSSASDCSLETRRKAAAADRLRGGDSSVRSSSTGTSTATLPQALRQLAKLSAYRPDDWVSMFSPRCGSLDDMHAAEAEMLRIEAELEGVLNRFKAAEREAKLVFAVQTKILLKQERERAERDRERERGGSSDQALCCICLTEAKSVLLMPCRHLCVCQACSAGPPSPQPRSPRNGPRSSSGGGELSSKMLKLCPVCRAPVAERIVVYG